MKPSTKDGTRGEIPGSPSLYGSLRVPCAYCDTEIRRPPSVLAKAGGKAFCNRACFTAWNKGRPRRPRMDTGQRRAEWVEKPCAYENVHHRNGKRDDNRRRNLELWVVGQPKGQRAVDALAWAREVIAIYEPVEALLS